MPITLHDWFCLNSGRDNFKPRVSTDRNLIFCHSQIVNENILASMQMRFAAGEPVKMMLYGDWGVGKTHAVNHISWWLEQHKADFPAKTIMIEIGDVTKKSRFDVIVRPFIDRLGLDFLTRLVHGYLKAGSPNIVASLQQVGVSPHIANAFSKFLIANPGDAPPPNVLHVFEYLKGQDVKNAVGMGLTQQLTDSGDFYYVLYAIGAMYKAVHNERLLFIADEAAKLEDVSADDATLAHWVATNRLIFDDNNDAFGFIYTLSAKGERQMPEALMHSQILNRIGNNRFELRNLGPNDVGEFVRHLIDSFVDRTKVEALVNSGEIPSATYDTDSYPFSKKGMADFLDFWSHDLENAKPRDISDRMNSLGFVAIKDNKRLIDPDCLKKLNM